MGIGDWGLMGMNFGWCQPARTFVCRSSVVTIGIVVKAGRQGRVEWRLCEYCVITGRR